MRVGSSVYLHVRISVTVSGNERFASCNVLTVFSVVPDDMLVIYC